MTSITSNRIKQMIWRHSYIVLSLWEMNEMKLYWNKNEDEEEKEIGDMKER